MVIGRITRKVTTVVLIAMLVPAPGLAWQPSRHYAIAPRAIVPRASNSLAERVLLSAMNSTEQQLITGPGRPQTYLVFSVNMAVPPARPLINAGFKKWLDQFLENLKYHPMTAASPAVPIAGATSISASGLNKLPDALPVDVNTADPARSMRVALDDALTKAGIDTNQGRITSKDGAVTYEGEQQDGDVLVTGRMVDGKMVLTKQFTPVASGTAAVPAAVPSVVSVSAPVATPLSASPVAYNTQLRESLEKTVKAITQDNTTPAVLFGQVLVRNTYVNQLDSTAKSMENLLKDPVKLDAVVRDLREGAGAVDAAYQNMIGAQQTIAEIDSRTRTNQKARYEAMMRDAAALDAQGDAAGAAKIRESARDTAYGNFIEKQQIFFAALDQNPLLGLGERGSFLFKALRNTLADNAPNRDYVALVTPFLQQAAAEARKEMIRVIAITEAKDFLEFGSPKYERTRDAVAGEGTANGSNLPRSLAENTETEWNAVDRTNAVSTEITNFGLNLVAGSAWIIPGIGPLITAGVAAIQVVREGKDVYVTLLDAEDARKLAGTTGYVRVLTAEDRLAAEKGEFVFALGGALLEGAQAIKVLSGLRQASASARELKAAIAAATAEERALFREIFDGNLAEARAVGVPEDRIKEILSHGAAGDPEIADALYLEILNHQGKQLGMPLSEYLYAKALDVRNKTGHLTEADFAYLRDKLAADPHYLDNLPDRGRLRFNFDRDGKRGMGDGFDPSLTAAQRDDLLRNPRVVQLVDEAKQAAAKGVNGVPQGSVPPRVNTQDGIGTVIVPRGQPTAATAATADATGTVIVPRGTAAADSSGTVIVPRASQPTTAAAAVDRNAITQVDRSAITQVASDVIEALPKAIQSGQTPQQAANAVRGMSLPEEGLKQLTQTLIQQLFEGRHVPMSDLGTSSNANPRNEVGVSIEALGVSSGVAFNVTATNNGSLPIQLQGEGIVVEPVRGAPSTPVASNSSRSSGAPAVTTDSVEAFCLERVRPVAPPGTQYRVAPPAVQAQHHQLLDVLHAAQRVDSLGLLHPDSEVKSYFNFVRQWSIWSKQENFDEKQFTEEFLNQTKKNVEAKNIKWTDDMKNTVRKAAPGRFKDISAVLNEANQPKIRAAIGSQTPSVITASIVGVDAASAVTLYTRRRDRIGEMS